MKKLKAGKMSAGIKREIILAALMRYAETTKGTTKKEAAKIISIMRAAYVKQSNKEIGKEDTAILCGLIERNESLMELGVTFISISVNVDDDGENYHDHFESKTIGDPAIPQCKEFSGRWWGNQSLKEALSKKDYQTVREVMLDRKSGGKGADALKMKLEALMQTLNTYKQLVAEWPEVTEFAKDVIYKEVVTQSDESKGMIVSSVKDINDVLGLPEDAEPESVADFTDAITEACEAA